MDAFDEYFAYDAQGENFTGKEKDDETELNYFGARYLDPMLGLWTSVDPYREFWNSYAYGPANPLNGYDKGGLYWEFAINSGRLTYIDNSTGKRTLVAFGYAGRDDALDRCGI